MGLSASTIRKAAEASAEAGKKKNPPEYNC